MDKLADILNSIVEEAFKTSDYDSAYARIGVSDRPDLCEYQCNGAMALAKTAKKPPMVIAEEVVEKLKAYPQFSKVEAVRPGFINVDISTAFLSDWLVSMSEDERLGLPLPEKKKKIIIDYGGANVAKPLHIGHLRSAIIGEAIKRIGRAVGHELIGDVHLGDWGLQMGLIIEELKDRGMEDDFTLSDLEEIYPAASARSKEKGPDGKLTEGAAKFRDRALEATVKLQNKDEGCMKIWRHIMELSIKDLKHNYDALGVSFELWKGESDAQKYIPDMLKDMEERGIAYESQGALVVDIAEEGDTKEYPPCIVRKSDGASLYATTDLATLVEREKLYEPDAYIYVADQRQSLHYLSFFRVARRAGIVRPEEKLDFLGFGTMNGKDGKPFKTRDGGVMRLASLIEEINEKVYEKIRLTRDKDEISDEEASRIASIVGLSALKYGDLSNQASKDYIFDIDRFTSFEGNTGPYILYTIVRIGSILERYQKEGGKDLCKKPDLRPAIESDASAKKLALSIARYSETVYQAWEELAPHKLCQYIYETADEFNSFYHDVRILNEKDEEKKLSYIVLLSITRSVLLSCIDMLGFSAPERM